MCHEHGAARELPEARHSRRDRGRSREHAIGDARECRDEGRNRSAGIDQRLILAEHLAAAHLDRADLGDAGIHRLAPGGLEVDDHEGDLAQGRAEIVEGELLLHD